MTTAARDYEFHPIFRPAPAISSELPQSPDFLLAVRPFHAWAVVAIFCVCLYDPSRVLSFVNYGWVWVG